MARSAAEPSAGRARGALRQQQPAGRRAPLQQRHAVHGAAVFLPAATAQYGAVVTPRGGLAGGGARQGRTSHSAPAPRSGGCWSAELGALSPPTSSPLRGR